ncbi:hypothetical protein BT93_G0103 [Corymbia citriodora subsp. variegata]|nr:hypothetical protein BT93_G0103 [Corymbia citriodora subsp. variegata]
MFLLMPRHAKVLPELGTRFRHSPSASTRSLASLACSVQEDHGAIAAIAQREGYESRAGLDLSRAAGSLQSCARPCGYDLVRLIRAAAKSGGSESHGLQLQGHALKRGFGSDVFVMTALMSFHVEKGSLRGAHNLFDEIPEPNVVSWNTLISGHLRFGLFWKALSLFVQLNKSETCVGDAFSVTAALAACGRSGLLQLGRSLHSKIVKVGMQCSVFVSNCLIDMYGKCGWVQEAVLVFGAMCYKDTVSWNSVLSACARNQNLEEALNFLQEMPNPDTISYNEFGNIEYAVQTLLYMPKPNSSSWNSIITGYVNRNRSREALNLFTRMHLEGMEMDQFTFSSILSGIGSLAALSWGIAIHCCTTKCGFDSSVVVGSALVDMYSKCGQVEDGELMFDSLPHRNLITWNAMISGFAHNGYFAKVVHCFEQLLIDDIEPDEITFLNVLSAFSHGRVPSHLVMKYLESMINDYRIDPTAEHSCSIIRLMGQRGEVWRAGKMIHKLGFSAWASVWRALLGACGSCRDLETAKIAAAKLIQLEGDEDYIYVAMSNIYASHGKWSEAGAVRELMRSRGVRKGAGFSWIQVKNVVSNSGVA